MPDAPGPARRPIGANERRLLVPLVAIALGLLGFVALDRLTRQLSFARLHTALHDLPASRLALALAFTALSYLALTFYDVLALRLIGRPLPWRTAALASFASYTVSHNLGLSLLTGGSVRYRVYTGAGLDGSDIARVIGIAGMGFWTGVVAIAGAALVMEPGALTLFGHSFAAASARTLGWLALAAVALLVGAGGVRRRPWRLGAFAIPLPTPGMALAQLGAALLDLGFAATALFVLIPAASPTLLAGFVLAYALGIIVTALSHVPGGIGVFEAVVLAVLPIDRTTLFAALIAYRVIYYLLPLAAGLVLLAWHEGRQHATRAFRLLGRIESAALDLAPLLLAASTFTGGGMLLLSVSLPSLRDRIGLLAGILPLPFIEASQLATSFVGTALLILAPGLLRRLDGAFVATRALLVAGAIFSLAKGIDYEEATVCLFLAGLLQWARSAFYRRTALTQVPLTPAWLASVVMFVGLAGWAGFFAYRTVPYAGDLWWHFALYGDAPRFLRAMLGVAVTLFAAALWRLLAAPPAASLDRPVDPRAVNHMLAAAQRTDAMLALTGDKRFLISTAGDALLMYATHGATWVVMGDPVGPQAAWGELLWRLRALVDRQQGRLLLYEISPAMLDLAVGLGLQLIKIGEEGIVALDEFSLDGPALRSARKAARAAARKGAGFRIVPAARVPAIMPELAEVSAEWRARKGGREKGFSIGRFDPAYLARFDLAVVEVAGRIVAFANLWLTQNGGEASVDLMRHRHDAPPGTMDFLFVSLLQWSRGAGYARFSLGMAPLSGIDGRRLAPTWARAAAFVFRHGERFYGFRGLRAYKEKFMPRWEPRYIAGPAGLGLMHAMRDLTRLLDAPPLPLDQLASLSKKPEISSALAFAA